MQQTIFITGGAGYVGEMLCEQFGKRDDVARVITLDKEPQSEYSKALPKVTYIQANMANDDWQEHVATFSPTVVIHTAWQIRAMYGQSAEQWRWNIEGSDNVFAFAFGTPSVKKLIHFSTAASYGAQVDNTFTHRFTEAEGFRPDEYIYAKEKKVAEDHLQTLFTETKATGQGTPQVFIVRPAAITGPRGRFMRIRFGLQSALQGNLKGGFVNKTVSLLTTFIPATSGWVRQFIHEDDVTDIMMLFSFEPFSQDYMAFNMTPESALVLSSDMARAMGKRVLPIAPWMARFAFFFFWHATRGKIPTCAHVWRFYSYPIVMSGAKLATVYECKYTSQEAIEYTDGRYADWVPVEQQKLRPAQPVL